MLKTKIPISPAISKDKKSRMYKLKLMRGFTFIEVAISVAVLAILATVAAPIIAQGIDAIVTTRTQETLMQDARFAMNWMVEELKNNCQELINVDGSIPLLSFYPDASDHTKYIVYYIVGNNLMRSYIEGANQTDYLIAENVALFEPRGYEAVTTTLPAESSGWTNNESLMDFIQISLTIQDQAGEESLSLISRITLRALQ